MMRYRSISTNRRFRRGGAYFLVIGVAMLITVIGMGALLSARVAGKEAATSTDWEEAGILAQAGVEHAVSYLNAQVAANPTTWRNSFTSYTTGNAYVFTQSMGRGTWSWVVKDKVDGNFSNNYADPFTLYGIGVVNQAKRLHRYGRPRRFPARRPSLWLPGRRPGHRQWHDMSWCWPSFL